MPRTPMKKLLSLIGLLLILFMNAGAQTEKESYQYWFKKGQASMRTQDYEQAGREFKLADALCEGCAKQAEITAVIDKAYRLNVNKLQQALNDLEKAQGTSDSLLTETQRKLRASELLTSALEQREINPTYAFRIAEKAWRMDPENSSNAKILNQMLEKEALFDLCLGCAQHNGPINSVSFSPDGQYILTGSWDKTAKLWDLSGKEVQRFSGHGYDVNSVSFSPDGLYFLTSDNPTPRLWRSFQYYVDRVHELTQSEEIRLGVFEKK